ncbi:hypothetical protein BS17DRAFT_877362 [Gyrodon lividus]|nr:hypothetical protein BS17DRAFT_877362 [Gyrodon lividus]
MNAFPNGTRVFFWTTGGEIKYGAVQSTSRLVDARKLSSQLMQTKAIAACGQVAIQARASGGESIMQGHSEHGFSGLLHFCGTNSKSYTLEGAVRNGYSSPDVSLTQNIQSGGESSATHCTNLEPIVDGPDTARCSSIILCQDAAGSIVPDLAAPPSTPPGASKTTHHHCLVQSRTCEWLYIDQGVVLVCGKPISCATASQHLTAHGIEKMNKKVEVTCWWGGCCKKYRRDNIIRHLRECHLGHKRGSS